MPLLSLLAVLLITGIVLGLLFVMARRGMTFSAMPDDLSADAMHRRGKRAPIDDDADPRTRACTHPLCKHLNRAAARFCAQCGKRLA